MSYRDTYENLCVLLEEYAEADVEQVAQQILAMLGLLGEDVLEALDPPPGLQHWLLAHGLSLVATVEARSLRVWEALEAEEASETPENSLEERDGNSPLLQVGDYVEYRTAPRGRDNAQQIGSGWVKDIGDGFIWLRTGGPDVYIVPGEGDLIRLLTPGPAHPQSAEAPRV
jgi:hypothetical protein